jgi:molecular chaperone DnaJ
MSRTGTHDPYTALGVSPDASADEIKKAYRRLAKKYHPDSTGGDKAKEAKFKEVTTAYDIVGDPKKRAQYDAMRKGGFRPGMGGGAGQGAFDLGDLFAQMFSGARPGGPGGGAGSGDGSFTYRVFTDDDGNVTQDFGDLSEMFGRGGFGGGRPNRRGRRPRTEPPQPAERKVRASDGSILIQRGADVHSDVRLTIDQAILGTAKEVATVDGKATIKIPPGTSSGVKLRLKGKGALSKDGARGSHFVTVHIDVPTQLDEDAKRLLVQFMRKVK